MKKVIITGPTGAIGVALINKLIQKNIEILVITRKESKRNRNIPKHRLVTILYSDLQNLNKIENINNEKYDVFYHFAWAGTTGKKRNDMYIQNNNVKYTLAAVELANKFKCKIFIGAGSQAEYGLCSEKINADTKTNPFTGYGMAKLCAGQMSRQLANSLGMKHIWTRILSVYGPYDNETSLIMTIIKNISNNKETNLTKGEQIWDYIYSEDVAQIFYLLGQKGIDGKTYIIGSGVTKTIKEYVDIIKKETKNKAKINFGAIPYNEKQVMYLCADNKELLEDLDYTIQYTFEKGIKKLIEWYVNK